MNPTQLEAITKAAQCAEQLTSDLLEATKLATDGEPFLSIALLDQLEQAAKIKTRMQLIHLGGDSTNSTTMNNNKEVKFKCLNCGHLTHGDPVPPERCPECYRLATLVPEVLNSGSRNARWNGEKCLAQTGTVIVGKSPKKTWWCHYLVGQRRKCVRVDYHGDIFWLDDEDGSGSHKVFETAGGPFCANHKSLPVDDESTFIAN